MEIRRYLCGTSAKILMVLLAVGGSAEGKTVKNKDYYCAINKEHTMCQYTKFDSMRLHCRNYTPIPWDELKPIILRDHNTLRNRYASREVTNFTVPNMLALEWDSELAEIAGRWAWQCPYYEDEFRDVDRFKVANVVGILPSELGDTFPSLDSVWKSLTLGNHTFHRWHIQQGTLVLKNAFRLDEPLSILTNPYLKHVGCSAARYVQVVDRSHQQRTILVCNYGPIDAPYSDSQPTGPPCSQCPSATMCISKTYRNLCIENLLIHDHQLRMQEDIEDSNEVTADTEYYGDDHEGLGTVDEDGALRRVINKSAKYCDILCDNGKKHTMCEYTEATSDYDEVVPIMGDDMHVMLVNVHNIVRNNFAAGRWDDTTFRSTVVKETELPLAANMREMQWNDELAEIALMWTMQCKDVSDECRDTYIGEDEDVPTYVSQLIDATNWTGNPEFPSPEVSFFKWYNVYTDFTQDQISPFRGSKDPKSRRSSSFAQIIWGETYQIGCAMTLCRMNNFTDTRIVTACNYAPGGMVEGHNVYVQGGPCTYCKRINSSSLGGMYCSKEYRHLCSRAESLFSRFALLALPSTPGLLMILQSMFGFTSRVVNRL